MDLRLSTNIYGYIWGPLHFEEKILQGDKPKWQIWSYVGQGPDLRKKLFLEFYCGHFKPFSDEKHSEIRFLGQF